MLCDVCATSLEGIHDPRKTPRIALRSVFNPHDWKLFTARKGDIKIQEVENHVFGHHKDQKSCEVSSAKGCLVCKYFLSGIEHGNAENFGYFWAFSVSWWQLKGQDVLHMSFFLEQEKLCDFQLFPFNGSIPDANLNLILDPITNGAGTVRLIKSWLSDCLSSHAQCNKSLNSGYVPTRVLEIGKSSYRLVLGSDLHPSTKFVSLSYCWGEPTDTPPFVLNKETLTKLQSKQPIAALPKTFRDAMDFSKQLGIYYIWIDRLCILQDCLQDWNKEAAAMRDVYENAFLTIAALGAPNDNGGCFFQRSPREVAPTIVWLNKDNSQPEPYMSLDEKDWGWKLDFTYEPLRRRAWVVQERYMSSRTIYFGRKQVYWDCWERNACEIRPRNAEEHKITRDSHHGYRRNYQLWKPLLLSNRFHSQVDDEFWQIISEWNEIVGIYSACKLTQRTDKLVAIAGLAQKFRNALNLSTRENHQYFAGHWEKSLPESLTWRSIGGNTRYQEYIAPSWSWASMDGQVQNRLQYHVIEQRILYAKYCGAHIDSKGDLGTDRTLGGWVRLEAPLVGVELHLLHADGNAPGIFFADCTFICQATGAKLALEKRTNEDHVVRYDDEEEKPTAVFGTPIMAEDMQTGYRASILLLLESPKPTQGVYRRTGILDAWLLDRNRAASLFSQYIDKEIVII